MGKKKREKVRDNMHMFRYKMRVFMKNLLLALTCMLFVSCISDPIMFIKRTYSVGIIDKKRIKSQEYLKRMTELTYSEDMATQMLVASLDSEDYKKVLIYNRGRYPELSPCPYGILGDYYFYTLWGINKRLWVDTFTGYYVNGNTGEIIKKPRSGCFAYVGDGRYDEDGNYIEGALYGYPPESKCGGRIYIENKWLQQHMRDVNSSEAKLPESLDGGLQ